MYGLRWDVPHETADPSTFFLDKKGMVVFEKIAIATAIACLHTMPSTTFPRINAGLGR